MSRSSSMFTASRLALALLVVGLTTGAWANEQPVSVEQAVCDTFAVNDYTIVDLELPPDGSESIIVPITLDGARFTMVLDLYSLRSEDFRVLVPRPEGMVEVPAPPVRTYRGALAEWPDSVVAARLQDGQLGALIRTPEAEWGVQPLSLAVPGAAPGAHVVFRKTDMRQLDVSCGLDMLTVHPDEAVDVKTGGADEGGYGTRVVCPKTCEIAFDADYEFYTRNGSSVSNTVADIEYVLNGVEAIYDRDTDIVYTITTVIVRDSEPDPYTSTDAGTLLDQFRSEWNSNQTGVHRDVAHLMTGKSLDGSVIGVAWLSVICNSTWGYGLSESRFTSNYNYRVGLTAHEVGHNWSAPHCDGDSDCYIMCSGIGGCSGDVTRFGSRSVNSITSFRDTRACLSEDGPVITGQPTPSQTVCEGDLVSLSVSTDAVLPEYQWRIGTTNLVDDGIHIFGATTSTLSILGVTAADEASNYNCVITDPLTGCSSVSDNAEILVDTNVANITAQPQDMTVNEGDLASFSVTVDNALLYNFQWRMNGSDLTEGGRFIGTQSTTLYINPTQAADDGATFDCVITSQLGAQCSVVSDVATLTVIAGNNCPEDLDGDGTIGLGDLSILLANYGLASGANPEDGDLNGDGAVDLNDLSLMLAVYGQDCPTR